MCTKPTAALAATIVLLAGCRSTPATPAAPANSAVGPSVPITDSCALLTPAEVSDVIGSPIDPGKHVLATSPIMCKWSQTGAAATAEPHVMINFTSLDSVEREKEATQNVTITPVDGVGDDAFYVTSRLGISLYVRKGNSAFVVAVRDPFPPDQLKTKEKTLGLKAAARL